MQDFLLDTQNAEAWRRALLTGSGVPGLQNVSAITLAGGVDLFLTAIALRDKTDLLSCLSAGNDGRHAFWKDLSGEWAERRQGGFGNDIHGIRTLEFFRLRNTDDQTCLDFSLYQQRFHRSMAQNGFPKDFSRGLVGVFAEMTDNVVQHSGLIDGEFTGIAGYHVSENHAEFVVGDIGRGILSRLKDSATWKGLATAREALRAIVKDGASSRDGQGHGEGFRQLFASLVDHNAIIRLRTDDSVLMIDDKPHQRQAREMVSPFLPGVQVSVCCSIGRATKEISLKSH